MIKKLVYIFGVLITLIVLMTTFFIIGISSIVQLENSEYIKENVLDIASLKEFNDTFVINGGDVYKNVQKWPETIYKGLEIMVTPSTLVGWVISVIAILILVGLVKFWIYIYLYREYIPLYLQSGGRIIDKKGVYGTANWMDQKKLKYYLRKKYINLTDGIPLGTINNPEGKKIANIRKELITTPNNPRFNDNIIVFAPPAEGKTFSFVFTTILNLLYSNDKYRASFILNDSKGDVYKKIGKYLREEQGYTTYLCNLLSPLNSDRINVLDWIDSEKDAMVIVDLILKNTVSDQDQKGSGDPFWSDAEEAIFIATLLLYKFELKVDVNMAMIYDFFAQNTWEEISTVMSSVDKNRPCRRIFNTFLKIEDPKIRGNIVFGLTIRLKLFALDEIRELTSCTDIDIYKLKTEETALFFCIPDTNSTMNYLVAVIKGMIAEKLVPFIDNSNDKRVMNRKIIQIDDEIANTGNIPQYSEWINTFRSRKWILIPIFQNLKQTEEMFGEQWMKVYAACHTKIFIGINDPETGKFVSEELGIQSVRVMSKFKESGIGNMLKDERWSQTDQKTNLKNPDELRNLNIDLQVVIRRGCDSMLLYKVGWDKFAKEYKKANKLAESVYEYKPNSRNEKKIKKEEIGNQVMNFSSNEIKTSHTNEIKTSDIVATKTKNEMTDTYDLSDLEDGSF